MVDFFRLINFGMIMIILKLMKYDNYYSITAAMIQIQLIIFISTEREVSLSSAKSCQVLANDKYRIVKTSDEVPPSM